MQWENLTAPDFAAAVEESQGVCVLPLPCIEKHGEHLPLGTDFFIGMEAARRAAEIEPAIVFPPFYLTQILEAKHQPGTIAIGGHLMLQLLEAMYPDYDTLIRVSNWSSSLQKYTNALKHLETAHERQGQIVFEGMKEDVAGLFTLSNTFLKLGLLSYR